MGNLENAVYGNGCFSVHGVFAAWFPIGGFADTPYETEAKARESRLEFNI